VSFQYRTAQLSGIQCIVNTYSTVAERSLSPVFKFSDSPRRGPRLRHWRPSRSYNNRGAQYQIRHLPGACEWAGRSLSSGKTRAVRRCAVPFLVQPLLSWNLHHLWQV